MHEATTILYEAIHDYNGDPHVDVEYVKDRLTEYRKWISDEIDLIRQTIREYDESVGGDTTKD